MNRLSLRAHSRTAAASALVAFVIALLPLNSSLAADADDSRAKANTCLGCHGVKHYVNTYPTYHVPYIAGQHEAYLVDALKAYRSEQRPHPTMRANAGSMSDSDIAEIAAYFSQQGEQASGSDGADAPAAAATCASCHGPNGNAPTPTFPILAGQYEDYLANSLKAYRDGDRTNAIMAPMAAALTDADIDELAKWYSSQKGPLKTAE